MNYGTLASLLSSRLGNRTGLSAKILAEVQAAQEELELDSLIDPYFNKVLSAAFSLSIAGVQSLANLTGFRRVAASSLWTTAADGTGKRVSIQDYDYARSLWGEEAASSPEVAAIFGHKLYLFPSPDVETYTGKLFYYQGAVTLTGVSSETNTWTLYAPQLLLAKTGENVAAFLRDVAAVQYFQALYEKQRVSLNNRAAANEAEMMEGIAG